MQPTGQRRTLLQYSRILSLNVAENSRICTSGLTLRMKLSILNEMSLKPSVISIWSASSKTSTRTASNAMRRRPIQLSSVPGVPMMTWSVMGGGLELQLRTLSHRLKGKAPKGLA